MENNIASNESVIDQTEPTATEVSTENTEVSTGSDLNDTSTDKPVVEVGSDVWDEDFNMDGEAPVEDAPEAAKKVVDEPIDLDGLYSAQMDSVDAVLDKPVLIKLNGKVTEITNINDMKDLMERGLGATKKYQEMSEDRKVIEFMNNNGISMETLNQLITSDGSVPIESNNNSQQDTQIQAVVDKISSSAYVDDFKNGVSFLPDSVKDTIGNSPELLNGLYGDFESGLAQQVLPIVERTMAIKGLDFVSAYTQAVQSLEGGSKPIEKKVNPLTAEPRGNTLGVKAEPKQDVWAMSSDDFKQYM